MKIPIQYRIGVIACFGMLVLVAYVTVKTWTNPPIEKNTLERIVEIRKDTVRHYGDDQGRTHGEVRVAESDATSLQAVFPFMDSVLRSVGAMRKQVDALAAMSSSATGAVRPHVETVVRNDRSFQKFSYKDKWLNLEGVLSDTPLIKYATFDSFLVTTYWKRKWFLGPKTTYLDAYSLNPSSKVHGLTGLKVNTERPKRFGIGPYIGYGWNGQSWSPSVGLSLQYSLIKF